MRSWEDIEIIGGGTRELRADFRQKMIDSGEVLSIDEFVYEGGRMNARLNDSMKKWKNFSKSRYVINTLCQLFPYDCGEDQKRRLFEEQESGEVLSESSEEILSGLTDRVIGQIEELADDEIRSELEQRYTRQVIRDNLLDLKEDFFLEFLAPICDMDPFAVMTFMWRVFKRDELSNYRTREFLLDMAMEIHEQYEKDSTIEILYRLKACYDAAVPAEKKERVPEQDGTRYIAKKSRFELENVGETFRPEDHPRIREVMSWYKAAVRPSSRNRKAAYEALFEETVRLYSDEMDDFLRVVAPAKKKRAKLENRENFSVPVTIWYNNSKGMNPVLIREGTKFFGKNCEYELRDCVELPPVDYVQVCVHVVPHPDNSALPKPKAKSVPEDVGFTILEGNVERDGMPVVRNIRTAAIKNVEPEKTANLSPETTLNSSLWTKPKWTREDYKKKQAYTGFVVMDVMVGERIPEDLCFAYNGFKFTLADMPEEEKKACYSKKTVTVSLNMDLVIPENVKHDTRKKIYILDAVRSITRMSPMPDVVVEISNQRNRVTVPEDRFEDGQAGGKLVLKVGGDRTDDLEDISEMRKGISDLELFQRYMYGQEDYRIVSGLDIMLTGKIGLDMRNLSSDWLSGSRILGDSQWFSELSEYRQRSVILVLLFLQYVKKGMDLMKTNRERFVRNFRSFVSTKMNDFRFDSLYLGYPLDCLLLFLLGACVSEDICDTLRMIYKENERALTA